MNFEITYQIVSTILSLKINFKVLTLYRLSDLKNSVDSFALDQKKIIILKRDLQFLSYIYFFLNAMLDEKYYKYITLLN